MTEGFSGSDLKNLCVAAAYIPIREILDKEKVRHSRAMQFVPPHDRVFSPQRDKQREPEPFIRPLTIEDFRRAKHDICASVSEDAFSIGELRKWNEMYGEGGTRVHSKLSYFM